MNFQEFLQGKVFDAYKYFGAHLLKKGAIFRVYAPNAAKVELQGDFSGWELLEMKQKVNPGVFEVTVQDAEAGMYYKYAITDAQGNVVYHCDPYGMLMELRPGFASRIVDENWKFADDEWTNNQNTEKNYNNPMNIYELHAGSWKQKEDGSWYNYEELAEELIPYLKKMGFNYIEFLPLSEHPADCSWGYQNTGFFSPTSRYGTAEELMKFIDACHKNDIGVIMDFVPVHFAVDHYALADYDGTSLYEYPHQDVGVSEWGSCNFMHSRGEVRSFLQSAANYWLSVYHVDGIRMDAVASMLYLDYGKNDGEWVANIYGGNENLEAIEFLKHLNSIFKKKYPDALLIAEESTAWPKITGDLNEEGLGFDYKWNMGWMNDFVGYMRYDPVYRGAHHDQLTFSMVYAYSEKFCLTLSHDEVVHGKASMLEKMPGNEEQKFANLKAAYGYMLAHPGKKLLFMGQDFGQHREWSEKQGLDWELLEEEKNQQMQVFMKALLKLYREQPALYEKDFDPEGFEWINCLEWEKNLLIFLRKGKKKEETLLIVCNFSGQSYENFRVGVPYPGKYKEIFNSDAAVFGGTGFVNPRVKISKNVEHDERKNSITIKIAPLSAAVFKYSKAVEKLVDNKTAKSKTKRKMAAAKKDLKKELQEKIEKEEKRKG